MTILFMGGELDDFGAQITTGTSSGGSHETTTSRFRSAYARVAVAHTSSSDSTARNFLTGAFASAQSQFSVTFRHSGNLANAHDFFRLRTGTSDRLTLRAAGGGGAQAVILRKSDGTTPTTLATSASTPISPFTLARFDVIVDYAVAGRVRVYVDQVLVIDYSGDVTSSGTTALDGLALSGPTNNGLGYYSEVIACTQDSRSLSLATLAPNAAGDTTAWDSGAYTDIDEITASEVDIASSGTANQILTVNTTGMPSGLGTVSIAGVKVVGNAMRGGTGPTKLALGVRTGGSNSFATGQTLDYYYPVTTPATKDYFEVNPVTGLAWTASEIDALQLAFRSEA